MADGRALHLVILDDDWRPVHWLLPQADWRATTRQLLAFDSRWLALYQERPREGSAVPRAADIALTRMLCSRLRPLDLILADHLIHARHHVFSFRAAGLL